MTIRAVPPARLCLDARELEELSGALPLCIRSRSHLGEVKRCYPSLRLAQAMAALTGAKVVYRCTLDDTTARPRHYHLATWPARDVHTGPVRVRRAGAWERLMAEARRRAAKDGRRQHVYGERNEAGRWVYRSHRADFRQPSA